MAKNADEYAEIRILAKKLVSDEMFEAYSKHGGLLSKNDLIELEFQTLKIKQDEAKVPMSE